MKTCSFEMNYYTFCLKIHNFEIKCHTFESKKMGDKSYFEMKTKLWENKVQNYELGSQNLDFLCQKFDSKFDGTQAVGTHRFICCLLLKLDCSLESESLENVAWNCVCFISDFTKSET